MRIEFTKEEKIEALQKLGYTVGLYEGERNRGSYSSDTEKVRVKTMIAYHGDEPQFLDNMDWYHLINEYGLDCVFDTQMKRRIKDYILNKLT